VLGNDGIIAYSKVKRSCQIRQSRCRVWIVCGASKAA
jgi:hypothetical protein